MEPRVKRSYDATGRQEQARQNRRRIIDAAIALFSDRGYAGVPLTEIAKAAGVSIQTVYAAFGTKVALLKEAVDVGLAGDDEPVPVMQRDSAKRMLAEPSPYRALAMYAGRVREVSERAGGLLLAATAAASSDPTVAELVADLDGQRLRGMAMIAESIADKARRAGCLADGVTEEDIRDTLWVFNSPQISGLLLRQREWSPDRFEAWLTRTWTRLLLDPQ
jgi:AcrR family transcriptional regulator